MTGIDYDVCGLCDLKALDPPPTTLFDTTVRVNVEVAIRRALEHAAKERAS
jgi:hypothetical protein